MRVQILSDLHLEFASFDMPDAGADVIVLAGDIWVPGTAALRWAARFKSQTQAIVMVAGNHEYYDRELTAEGIAMADAARKLGIHLLQAPEGELIIDGVRFLGTTLWTDYQVPILNTSNDVAQADQKRGMKACSDLLMDHQCIYADVRARPKKFIKPADLLRLHEAERSWLQGRLSKPFAGKTVVVTHHAPHPNSIAPEHASDWVTTGFANQMPAHFFEVPALWVHGHTHTRFDYKVNGCRVVCNPRGYRLRNGAFEVLDFDPKFVIEL